MRPCPLLDRKHITAQSSSPMTAHKWSNQRCHCSRCNNEKKKSRFLTWFWFCSPLLAAPGRERLTAVGVLHLCRGPAWWRDAPGGGSQMDVPRNPLSDTLTHTHKNKKQRKLWHTSNGRSLFKSEWIQTANHLSIVDLSGSVLTPAGDSLQVSLKVWVTNLPCSIWVPHGHYHHGPESKQALLWHSTREVLSVMCSVCQ